MAEFQSQSNLVDIANLQAGLRFVDGALLERALLVTNELASTASSRDRKGGTALEERNLIRKSGLLSASIAKAQGGLGLTWPEVLDLVRLFARVDSSLAHVFGFQHLLLATSRLYGAASQWQPLHKKTAELGWFWGNALNPLDPGTSVTRRNGELIFSGKKSFSSGSVDADYLIVSGREVETQRLLVAAVPATRSGIRVVGDWDNIGQRQTDSGTVEFHDVHVAESEVLATPGPLGSVFSGLRSLIAQLTLSNVYLGIAEGALIEARKLSPTSRRATEGLKVSTTPQAGFDAFALHRYGSFAVAIAAARALADNAALALQAAYAAEDQLTETQRGNVAVQVAVAKVSASEAALKLGNEIFEVVGARATAAKHNLDRYWRNARTHTLHDPIDHKLYELGQFTFDGQFPNPGFYS